MEKCDFDETELEYPEASEIEKKFNRAADYLQHLVNKLDSNQLLEFYGLYKQSTVGPCNTSKPGIFSMQARAKWNAWNDLGLMNKEFAMRTYVTKLNDIESDWDAKNTTKTTPKKSSWVSVSTPMAPEDENVNGGTKTFIDHVKDENIDEVLAFFSLSISIEQEKCPDKCAIINKYGPDGLAAIHWAADRGYANILEILLSNGANVNLIDKDSGQTALHYAISCGHVECVKILLKYGANRNIADSDDVTCMHLANDCEDYNIIQLLEA